jgi:hypothetical protein
LPPRRAALSPRKQNTGGSDVGGGGGSGGGGGGAGGKPKAPPPAGTQVLTALAFGARGKCKRSFSPVTLRPQAAAARALTLCSKTAPLPAAGASGLRFITDVVVAAKSRPGARPPPLSAVACPQGYARLKKNLLAGLPAANGTAAAAVLCLKAGTDPEVDPPLTDLGPVESPDACADAAAGQQLALFQGEERAGEPANLAGTGGGGGGGSSYICLLY